MYGSHTGFKLATEIFDTLDTFNIAEKLFCITPDNASNNNKAMKCLSKLLVKRKGIKWDWKERHISCLNHVIDLAVQAFLKAIKVIENSETEEEEEDQQDDSSDDDEDELTKEEDEEEDLLLPSAIAEKVATSAIEFQAIMWKLREIVKVWPISIYSISKLISTFQENEM